MAEYSGINLAVFFNTVDISATGRRINVQESADEPEEYDTTHKGDSEKTVLEGLPGSKKTQVQFSALDESGGAAALLTFALNTKDTLKIYPEGKTQGKPELTLNNARLTQRTQNVEYNAPVPLDATFVAKNSLTRGTYSSP
jgi:hypothetical protein